MRAKLPQFERGRKRHERLKARLRLAGTSLAQVARDLDVRPTTVTSVSLGTSRSKRIEQHIAKVLSTSPERLWPERYQRNDQPEKDGPMS